MPDRRKAQGGARQPVKIEAWWEPLPLSHISNPIVSSAIILIPPQNAGTMLIQTNTQNIRYTLDGTTPTASTGFLLTVGADPKLIHLRLTVTVTIIEVAATANVEIVYGE